MIEQAKFKYSPLRKALKNRDKRLKSKENNKMKLEKVENQQNINKNQNQLKELFQKS